MKSKITKILAFALLVIVVIGTVTASASESYNTYTYSIDGQPLDSPAAYTTSQQEVYNSTDMGLTKKFGGKKIASVKPRRTIAAMYSTLNQRGDRSYAFPCIIDVELE